LIHEMGKSFCAFFPLDLFKNGPWVGRNGHGLFVCLTIPILVSQ